MKKLLLVPVLIITTIQFSLAQETPEFIVDNGQNFKVSYYENNTIKAKEQVYILDNPENGSLYRSLDYFEEFNAEGNISFKGNKITGKHIEFYNNGSKKVHGQLMGSQKEGRWIYLNENAKIIKAEIYRNGKIIDTINY